MNLCFIDVETTGLNCEKDKIVEIAIIIDKNKEIISLFQTYINHKEYPENCEDAFKINGLSKEFLEKNGIEEESALNGIFHFLNKYKWEEKFIIAGYNVNFDIGFFKKFFNKIYNYDFYFSKESLDVKKEVEKYCYENRFNLPNKKLVTCCDFFDIKINAHSAVSDIKATYELYYKILNNKMENKQ